MRSPQIFVFSLISILIFGATASVASTTQVFALDGVVEDDTNAGPPPSPPVEDEGGGGGGGGGMRGIRSLSFSTSRG